MSLHPDSDGIERSGEDTRVRADDHVWVRLESRAPESMTPGEALEHLRSQRSGDGEPSLILERAAQDDIRSVAMADLMIQLSIDVSESVELGNAWLTAQLRCDFTPTGRTFGAHVALAPERYKWRVYIVVPLLGRSFPSGKLNQTPEGALRSAARRLGRGGERLGSPT